MDWLSCVLSGYLTFPAPCQQCVLRLEAIQNNIHLFVGRSLFKPSLLPAVLQWDCARIWWSLYRLVLEQTRVDPIVYHWHFRFNHIHRDILRNNNNGTMGRPNLVGEMHYFLHWNTNQYHIKSPSKNGTTVLCVSTSTSITPQRGDYIFDSPMVLVEGFVMFTEFSSFFEPLVAFQYQAVAIMCGLVIQNAMTCRVFRLLRSGCHEDAYPHGPESISISTLRFDVWNEDGIEDRSI